MATKKSTPATQSTSIVLVGATSHDEVLKMLALPSEAWGRITFADRTDEEKADIARRMREREMNATTADELLGSGVEPTAGKNFVNKSFRLDDVEYQASDLPDASLPIYAVLHGVDLQGEVVLVTTGAVKIVTKAAKLAAEGWLPKWVKITEGEALENGGKPLDLVAAPKSETAF